ncbi:DUF3667 domain-containing protein [Flavobacterium chuncheonense]|uniref:DUF3667 domain-containing protein n=1 Tax=Flavobacterium chuncheonense TaxID=2026653 RepID=A0ABW5YL79_9FLAO
MGRKDAIYRGTECLNCHTPLDISERYCHFCGQLNSTKKVTLSDFIEEFFANFYAYDSKVRNTFTYLFTKPAFVAKQIINGKRQSFANPFRLFLSIVILFFLAQSFLENEDDLYESKITPETITIPQKDSIKKEEKKFYSEKELEKEIFLIRWSKKADTFSDYIPLHPEYDQEKTLQDLNYKDTKENHFLYKRVWLLWEASKLGFKSKLWTELVKKMPFIIFLLLPSIAFCFFLIFRNKVYTYTDNLIFVYTLASVYFLSLFLDLIVLKTTTLDIAFITAIVFMLYLYKSLRKFYNFSRWKTIYKFVLLNIVTIIVALPTLFFITFFIFMCI